MSLSISCIVPVFNEARSLAKVLTVISSYPGFDEVIVADDGSTDNSAEIIKTFPVTLIQNQENLGKAKAVLEGFKKSTGKIIVLLDADLLNLNHSDIDTLLEPVLTGNAMSISLLKNTWAFFWLIGIDAWSGIKALPKEVLEDCLRAGIDDKRYALETYINHFAIKRKLTFVVVPWPGVSFLHKSSKIGFFNGSWQDVKMFFAVYSTFGFVRTFWQWVFLTARKKRYES